MLNDTQALSKAAEVAGHQSAVDRHTDSELHVKSPFLFKMKIKLKRSHTRTYIPPPTKRSHHPPHLSVVKYYIHLKTYTLLHPSFFKPFLFHFFSPCSSNASHTGIARHIFCIIRASGCIWRQTNDSSAFRLKREPLLIYPYRYIDRWGGCNDVALSSILQHKPNDMTSDLSHLNYSHGFAVWQLLGMLMCIFQNSKSIGHHCVHAAVSQDEWLEWSRAAMK